MLMMVGLGSFAGGILRFLLSRQPAGMFYPGRPLRFVRPEPAAYGNAALSYRRPVRRFHHLFHLLPGEPDPAGAGTVAAGRELYAPEYGAVPAGGGPGAEAEPAVTVAILPVCGFLPHVGWERVSITNNEEKREDVL